MQREQRTVCFVEERQSFSWQGEDYIAVENVFCVHYEGLEQIPQTAVKLPLAGCYKVDVNLLSAFPQGSRAMPGYRTEMPFLYFFHPSKINIKKFDCDFHEPLLLRGKESVVSTLLSSSYEETNIIVVDMEEV
jgi:hypothetical protein